MMKIVSYVELSIEDYDKIVGALQTSLAVKTEGLKEGFIGQALAILKKKNK